MKKNLLLLLFPYLFYSQTLDEYPKNETFYEGGIETFYKEAHQFLTEKNIKECGENEIYVPRILVTEEGKVKSIQDPDTENINKNKCAYDISLLLLKNLKNWKPAEVKGKNFGAITDFVIYPRDLMSNYKADYNPEKLISDAEYATGKKDFFKVFNNNIRSLFVNYNINGGVNLEFYINEKGEVTNARIYPDVESKDFKNDFFRALKRVNKPWKPALYSNIPIRQRIAFPINFSTNFNSQNQNSNF